MAGGRLGDLAHGAEQAALDQVGVLGPGRPAALLAVPGPTGIDLLDGERLNRSARFADTLDAHLAPLRELPHVADVRTLGAVGVVELTHDVDVDAATAAALDSGAWIRPFRRLIYTMPPFVCTDNDLGTICEAVTAAVHACAPASEQAP